MARTKDLSHLLISLTDTVDAFTLGDTTYKVTSKIPAAALIALMESGSPIAGMRDYIVACIPDEEQKGKFRGLMSQLDVDGLSALIEEIVEATTPFDGAKPNA